MRELEDFTLKQVTDYLIEKIAEEKNISKTLARKLFINAITYNVVTEEIKAQIDFLMEAEDFEWMKNRYSLKQLAENFWLAE